VQYSDAQSGKDFVTYLTLSPVQMTFHGTGSTLQASHDQNDIDVLLPAEASERLPASGDLLSAALALVTLTPVPWDQPLQESGRMVHMGGFYHAKSAIYIPPPKRETLARLSAACCSSSLHQSSLHQALPSSALPPSGPPFISPLFICWN
ncbi:hypothetical protein KUCAC02_035089, partial [Chaenocephalus aceratus]